MQSIRKSALVLMIGVFAFSVSACGLDEYDDAVNTELGNFNAAGDAVSNQLLMINDDNTIISDPDWQSATLSALDEMEAAGKTFASMPETPAGYEQVNSLLTDLAFETNSFVDTTRSMIETEDLNQMDAVNTSLSNVNDLVAQIDAAISAANE